jgi:hypothetical protein
MDNYEKHYQGGVESFKDKGTFETFYKYLSWDNPIVKDFNHFCRSKGIKIEVPKVGNA